MAYLPLSRSDLNKDQIDTFVQDRPESKAQRITKAIALVCLMALVCFGCIAAYGTADLGLTGVEPLKFVGAVIEENTLVFGLLFGFGFLYVLNRCCLEEVSPPTNATSQRRKENTNEALFALTAESVPKTSESSLCKLTISVSSANKASVNITFV